jgi:hypothetical protein
MHYHCCRRELVYSRLRHLYSYYGEIRKATKISITVPQVKHHFGDIRIEVKVILIDLKEIRKNAWCGMD